MNIKTGCMFLAFWNICAVIQIVHVVVLQCNTEVNITVISDGEGCFKRGGTGGRPRTQQQEIRIKSM